MIVVALDTATPAVTSGVVEVTENEVRELAAAVVVDHRAAAEQLTTQIQDCLRSAGLKPSAVDAVVVGNGPGPFTGLRVGMATAAAYGDALDVPVYPVLTLDALADAALTQLTHTALQPSRLLVVTDARRREAYFAQYEFTETRAGAGAAAGTARLHRVLGPSVGPAAAIDAPTGLALPAVACGDPTRLAELPEGWMRAPELPTFPTVTSLVRCSAAQLRAGTPPAPLEPQYLRRPDAVPPRPHQVSAALIAPATRPDAPQQA